MTTIHAFDIQTEPKAYPQADPDYHRWDAGPAWCANTGDPHQPGFCHAGVGYLEADGYFIQVSVFEGRPTLYTTSPTNDVLDISIEDARTAAAWLTTAADLAEDARRYLAEEHARP